MYKKRNNISKIALISYLACFIGLSPALAQPKGVQLRGVIDDSPQGIKLKGEVNIDKSNQLISLNLRDSDTRQVLRMLADKAGVNIVFHDSVQGKITLDLVNVTVNKAFEYIMTMGGLAYWKDGNTLIVASKSVASGLSIDKTQLKPIQIKYLDAKNVASFLNSNIFSLNRPDISVSQVAITNPRTNQVLILGNDSDYQLAKKTVDLIDVKPIMKTFNVNYVDPGILASNVCTNVFNAGSGSAGATFTSSGSSGSGGVGVGSASPMGTVVICGSTISNGGAGGSSSDSSSGSSSVSSSSSSAGFGGIDSRPQSLMTNGFVVIADYDLNQISVSGSKDQINMAEDIINRFDKKQPQVYIEISIIELSESGSKTLAGQLMAHSRDASVNFAGGPVKVEYTNKSLSAEENINGMLTNLANYGNYKVMVSTLEALVQEHKGKVLANPRIIATNNRQSTINISSDFISKRTVDRTTTGNTIDNLINYEMGQAGITLSLTPKVSPNGYVTLNITPSYTSQKEQITEGTNIVATLLNRRDLNLQNVRVKDGETLVIGGLIQEDESNSMTKIPILGDIPIVGALFKNNGTDRSKTELILMITPKIIKDEEDSGTI